MGKSSLPRARTRGRHRRVEPKTWQHATPPRVIGYAVAVFLTVIAVSSAYHRTDAPQAVPEPAPQGTAVQSGAKFLVPQVTPTVPNLTAPTPEPRLVASETPAPAPTTTGTAPTTIKRPAQTEAPETTKAPKPASPTSTSAESSQPEPSQSSEPSQTTQPSEPPSESAPPSQPEPEPTPPSSSKPAHPGLLPELGGVIDGITGLLPNR
ncbi:hypothetical protein ACWDKQ_21405 [Saccharopolyspora sp. NPDC000995]